MGINKILKSCIKLFKSFTQYKNVKIARIIKKCVIREHTLFNRSNTIYLQDVYSMYLL
jgi:hypothetical protein